MRKFIIAALCFLPTLVMAQSLAVGDTLSCYQAKDEVKPEVTTEQSNTGCVSRVEPGKKFTIIMMSASWCAGCMELFHETIMPQINDITKNATLRYAGFDKTLEARIKYFNHLATTKKIFGASMDNLKDLAQYIDYIPSVILVDSKGKVLYFVDGVEAKHIANILEIVNAK